LKHPSGGIWPAMVALVTHARHHRFASGNALRHTFGLAAIMKPRSCRKRRAEGSEKRVRLPHLPASVDAGRIGGRGAAGTLGACSRVSMGAAGEAVSVRRAKRPPAPSLEGGGAATPRRTTITTKFQVESCSIRKLKLRRVLSRIHRVIARRTHSRCRT
jgi:hypothetical protein